MDILKLLLFTVALVSFVCAATQPTKHFNLMAAGLAACVLVPLIQAVLDVRYG